jgi:predicted P-loop ATPase
MNSSEKKQTLNPEHLAELQKSGLTTETIEKLGLYTESDPGQIAKLLRRSEEWTRQQAFGPCLVLRDARGTTQLKPTNPRTIGPAPRKGGDACGHNYDFVEEEDKRRVVKYETALESLAGVLDTTAAYIGPSDPDRIYVTEGFKKSAAMNQAGLYTYGLTGVDCAHDPEARRQADDAQESDAYFLQEPLASQARQGREICVVFDAPDMDGANANVIRAAVRILQMIHARGGQPFVSYVPNDGSKKVGVDDYYAGIPDEYRKTYGLGDIENAARPAAPNECLNWLIEQSVENDWSRADGRLEIKRAVLIAGRWWADDKGVLVRWISRVVKKLGSRFKVDADELRSWARTTAGPGRVEATRMQRVLELLRNPSTRAVLCGSSALLEMDARTKDIFLGRKPYGSAKHVTELLANVSRIPNRDGWEPRKDEVADALASVAEDNSFHPVREYLNGLTWDGTSRLRELQRVLRIPVEQRHEIHEVVLRKTMIAAVARALEPGCKVDSVLILVGPQGQKKSTFFKVLVGPEWFGDPDIDIENKDALQMMGRFWVIEWAELKALLQSTDSAVKAFITRTEDTFRPPYGKVPITVSRSCIMVGTTNDDEFLSDPTGNRRFWPIAGCGIDGEIDIEWVRQNRDQLWAEATRAYKAGEEWYLSASQQQELVGVQKAYEIVDIWLDAVAKYVSGKSTVTTAEVLTEGLHVPEEHLNNGLKMRVAKMLRHLDWTSDRSGRSSKRCWIRPQGKGEPSGAAPGSGFAASVA